MKISSGFLLFFCLFVACHAQRIVKFEFEDSTSIEVKIISDDPDEGRNRAVYFGFFGPEGINMLGFSWYQPKLFYLNAQTGIGARSVDASFFFKSWYRPKSLSQAVGYSGFDRYVGTINLYRRKSFGIHGGYSYIDYRLNVDGQPFTAQGAVIGLTYLSAKHIHWNAGGLINQGTSITRLNADLIYYFSLYDQYDGTTETRDLGMRVYMDGKTTLKGRRGRWAFHYVLGAGLNSDKKGLPFFGGLGIGYSF